jgi:hypothetical protein
VHSAHAERAAGFVNEFREAAVAALKGLQYSELEKAKTHFYHQLQYSGLSAAPIPEDPNSYEACAAWLLPHGWSGEEIGCVRQQLRLDGGTITAADYQSVTISGRVHSRERLRMWDKPKWADDNPWWDNARWAEKWPTIQPPAAQEAERPVDDGLPASWRYNPALRRAVRVAWCESRTGQHLNYTRKRTGAGTLFFRTCRRWRRRHRAAHRRPSWST